MIECPHMGCPLRLTLRASTRLPKAQCSFSKHWFMWSLLCTDISWIQGDAEELPVATASVDAYTIAFGIRNVTRIPKVTLHACFTHLHLIFSFTAYLYILGICLRISQTLLPFIIGLNWSLQSSSPWWKIPLSGIQWSEKWALSKV